MILSEHLNYNQAHIIVESDNEVDPLSGRKNLFMKGLMMMSESRNQNGRIYTRDEMVMAVNDANERLHRGESIFTELDHPETLTINLNSICGCIKELWMQGNDAYGKIKILPTPNGNIVRAILESGEKLGVSSRGSGNVDDSGMVSGFELVTIDVVANPSAKLAIPQMVYENKRAKVMHDLAEAASHDPKAQKFLTEELRRAIRNLKF